MRNNNNNVERSIKRVINRCNKILINNESRCQCYDNNNNPSNKFRDCEKKNSNKKCNKYNLCKSFYTTFMNNNEPNYKPTSWDDSIVRSSHNCYSYFLNDHIKATKKRCRTLCKKNNTCKKNKIKGCSKFKPQPGYYARLQGKTFSKKFTCKNMLNRIKLDNPNIKLTKFRKKCPNGYYKGALVVDPDNTYHFYRQDDNCRWSHKPGTLKVTNVDASGKPIYAPHLCDKNYNKDNREDGINYTKFCNYFCIPRNDYLDTYAI